MSGKLRAAYILALGFAAGCQARIGDAPLGGPAPQPSVHPSPSATPSPTPSPTVAPDPPFSPAEARLHRLTKTEYQASVRDLLGADLPTPEDLEVDTTLYGFTTVAAGALTVGPRAAEQFETAALDLAGRLFADDARRMALVGCSPASVDEPCVRTFLERFGRRAWRRPLLAEELDRWQGVARTVAAQLQDPWAGLEMAVAGMLESPSFLYRVETGAPDPQHPERLKLSGYEVAARLSYFIAGTTPDDALLDQAASGALDTPAGIEAAARALLADPRAEAAPLRFFGEHLRLDRLDGMTKNAELYPQMSPTLGRSMRAEIEGMIRDLVLQDDGDLRRLFDNSGAWVNDGLARLYQLPGRFDQATTRAEHPAPTARSGLLTTAGFLALNAHASVTSPTYRGRFVRQFLLCDEIPPPPPGVNTNLPEPAAGQGPRTLRSKLEELHLHNATCAGCHVRMDPLGFAFENFDAVGAYRTTDNGLPVDPRGQLDGRRFQSAKDLSLLIKDDPRLASCLSRMAYRYASGHLETTGETRVLKDLAQRFAASGYRLPDLVVALVTSDGFRYATPGS